MNSVVCDLETTSKNVFDAEIVDGHFIIIDENIKVLSTFELKCNPIKWSTESEEIHGISRHTASTYKSFKESYRGLLDRLYSYDVTSLWCYSNVSMFGKQLYYDHAVLRMNMMNMGDAPYFAIEAIRPYSVHTLCKMFSNGYNFENLKLSSVCKTLNIQIDAHNAKSDCEATLEILKIMLPKTSKEEVYIKEKGILNEESFNQNSKKPRSKKQATR